MDKLNKLSEGASRGVASVSGNISMTLGPNGVALHVPRQPNTGVGRIYVLTASSPTTVSGGGDVAFDAIEYDIPSDQSTFLMGILDSGAFTFQTTGTFQLVYSAIVSVDIGGATSTDTTANTVKTFLGIGGTDATRTEARFSALQKPNFKDFLKVAEGETLTLETDLSGLTMVSGVASTATVLDGTTQPTLTLTAESTALSGVTVEYGAIVPHTHQESDENVDHVNPGVSPIVTPTMDSDALSDVTINTIITATVVTSSILDGEGRIAVTQAEGTDPIPVDDTAPGYPDQLPDGLPTGTMFGTTSGAALIKVTRDELGDYYIEYNGTTGLPPSVSLKGGRHGGGSRPLTVESATLVITKIS